MEAAYPKELVLVLLKQSGTFAGLTPVDVAINNKQVSIVRRLEQGAAFAGWLTQKVTKYGIAITASLQRKLRHCPCPCFALRTCFSGIAAESMLH